MAGELEKRVREAMRKIDAKDWDALSQIATDDMRGVDEVTRKWTLGRKAIIDGLREAPIEDIHRFNGKPVHVSAPTTLLFRRTGSDWELALFHSVPLPDAG